MGMVAEHDIRAGIDGQVTHLLLVFIGSIVALIAPVQGYDDHLGTLFPQFLDIAHHAGLGDPGIVGINTHSQAVFRGDQGIAAPGCIPDTGIFQHFQGFFPAGLGIIPGMVIGNAGHLYAAPGQNIHIFQRTPETEGLGMQL